MEQTHYRKAELKDLGDLVELLRLLFSIEQDFSFDPPSHERGLRMLLEDREQRSVVIVAEREERVVGMVTVQLTVSTALGGISGWLEDLVVLPEHQNTGVGRGLLDELARWCSMKKCKRIQLLADKDNLPALDFYRKGNWQSTNMIPLKIHL